MQVNSSGGNVTGERADEILLHPFYKVLLARTAIYAHTRKVSWRKVLYSYSESLSGHQQVERVKPRPTYCRSNDFIIATV